MSLQHEMASPALSHQHSSSPPNPTNPSAASSSNLAAASSSSFAPNTYASNNTVTAPLPLPVRDSHHRCRHHKDSHRAAERERKRKLREEKVNAARQADEDIKNRGFLSRFYHSALTPIGSAIVLGAATTLGSLIIGAVWNGGILTRWRSTHQEQTVTEYNLDTNKVKSTLTVTDHSQPHAPIDTTTTGVAAAATTAVMPTRD